MEQSTAPIGRLSALLVTLDNRPPVHVLTLDAYQEQ